MQKITPFLWFNDQAEEAVKFYTSIFKNSKLGSTSRYDEAGAKASGRPKGSVMVATFQINGQDFTALNGGPIFTFSPSISFFVYCKTEKDINDLFKKLSNKGEIMMPLDKYPFGERYAFFKDKYGVAWQLMLSPKQEGIVPSLLFVGKSLGKAESAVDFYTKIFKKSKIDHMVKYEKGENGKEDTVKHSSFFLEGQEFMAMDGAGPHKFAFNESISFVVNCESQDEVDHYWEKLSEGGDEKAQQCGWLKDKFGISWQIVPTISIKMLQDKDPAKSKRVMQAILKMKKIDIPTLKKAYNQK
ncbi:MAG TPA: VOC family protein [Candidatus Nanoarchaeia archaeon]|nr:VOC family protein [Candidatus Nanoarchaeia archaeon]